MVRLDLDRIRLARTTIDPVFLDTPQYECAALGDVLGCSITLKIETLNPVRSFKGRGAETALSWLAQREEAPTAVCASAGNLGQALAYSGARRGIPVTVVAARTANPFKIERIAALGARVRLEGDDIEDARYANPPVTTISPDKDLIAETAVERLLKRIGSSTPVPGMEIRAPYRLIPRASTMGRRMRSPFGQNWSSGAGAAPAR